VRVFSEPRFDAKVDLDAHLRLVPKDARCKGMFFTHLFKLAEPRMAPERLLELASVSERRFLPFHDYAMADHMRLLHATAGVTHPSSPRGEALRRIGQTIYDGILGSHAGKVLFGVLGLDTAQILAIGPKAFKLMTTNWGEVVSERIDDRTFHVHYRSMPAFLETYHVGTVEGVLAKCGVRGRVRIHVRDLANASFEVTWVER
jgi:uncharacterized protein (TIGR02265 family)